MDFKEISGSNPFNPEHNFSNLPDVSGLDQYSELSNQDVDKLINKLIPEGLLNNCGSIVCNPNDPIWLEIPGTAGYRVDYGDGGSCDICIAGREIIKSFGNSELPVLYHEIGHNAYYNLSSEVQAEWSDIHSESKDFYNASGFGFVSNYAHTNLFEDFAETYAIYITNPDLLQFVSPEKYEFMFKRVFGGLEYGYISSDNPFENIKSV